MIEKKTHAALAATQDKNRISNELGDLRDQVDIKDRKVNVLQRKVTDASLFLVESCFPAFHFSHLCILSLLDREPRRPPEGEGQPAGAGTLQAQRSAGADVHLRRHPHLPRGGPRRPRQAGTRFRVPILEQFSRVTVNKIPQLSDRYRDKTRIPPNSAEMHVEASYTLITLPPVSSFKKLKLQSLRNRKNHILDDHISCP